jgi:hypothetical protein
MWFFQRFSVRARERTSVGLSSLDMSAMSSSTHSPASWSLHRQPIHIKPGPIQSIETTEFDTNLDPPFAHAWLAIVTRN